MDSSFQPIASIGRLWNLIEDQGWYTPKQGDSVVGSWCHDELLNFFGVSRDEAMSIRLPFSGLVGLDMQHPTGKSIFDRWQNSYASGLWNGPHYNCDPESWPEGGKWSKRFSGDPRVEGHRHDEAALSLILHTLRLKPESLGFLTLEGPEGFIGHHVKLVVPK